MFNITELENLGEKWDYSNSCCSYAVVCIPIFAMFVPALHIHQENCIYIIEEKNWRIILYYLELAQINANYMTLHFLLNQKGPGKF